MQATEREKQRIYYYRAKVFTHPFAWLRGSRSIQTGFSCHFFANPQLHKIVVLSIDIERKTEKRNERGKKNEKRNKIVQENKNKSKTINRRRLNQFKYYLNNRSAVEVKLIF